MQLVGCRLGGSAVPSGQVRAWFDVWQPDFWSTLLFQGGQQYAVQHFLSLASPWSVMRTVIASATPGTWPDLLVRIRAHRTVLVMYQYGEELRGPVSQVCTR